MDEKALTERLKEAALESIERRTAEAGERGEDEVEEKVDRAQVCRPPQSKPWLKPPQKLFPQCHC